MEKNGQKSWNHLKVEIKTQSKTGSFSCSKIKQELLTTLILSGKSSEENKNFKNR